MKRWQSHKQKSRVIGCDTNSYHVRYDVILLLPMHMLDFVHAHPPTLGAATKQSWQALTHLLTPAKPAPAVGLTAATPSAITPTPTTANSTTAALPTPAPGAAVPPVSAVTTTRVIPSGKSSSHTVASSAAKPVTRSAAGN